MTSTTTTIVLVVFATLLCIVHANPVSKDGGLDGMPKDESIKYYAEVEGTSNMDVEEKDGFDDPKKENAKEERTELSDASKAMLKILVGMVTLLKDDLQNLVELKKKTKIGKMDYNADAFTEGEEERKRSAPANDRPTSRQRPRRCQLNPVECDAQCLLISAFRSNAARDQCERDFQCRPLNTRCPRGPVLAMFECVHRYVRTCITLGDRAAENADKIAVLSDMPNSLRSMIGEVKEAIAA